MSQSLEINKMRREGLKWRLSAMPLTGEYGATLQLRGDMTNPKAMALLVALDLRAVAKELEDEGVPTSSSVRDDQA